MTALLRRCALAAALILSTPAFADDEPPEITSVSESDYAIYESLREADHLFSAREFRWRSKPEKMKRAAEEKAAAWQKSGWTREKHGRVQSLLNDAANALREAETGEDKASAQETLNGLDKTLVATAKAHRKEILESDLHTRMEKRVLEDDKAEAAGRVPSKAELQGTWVADYDATIDAMGGGILQGEAKEKAKAQMIQSSGEVTFTFKGDKVESKSNKGVEKGSFRLEGSTIFIKPDAGRREQKMEVGLLANGKLKMGRGMMGLIYSKK